MIEISTRVDGRGFPEVDEVLRVALTKQDDLLANVKSFHSLLDCSTANQNYYKILNITCNQYLMYWWILTFILIGKIITLDINPIQLPR